FDTFSIAALATELRETIIGGRVQQIFQVNSLTFGFEIFVHPTRHYLTISAEPQAPRLHFTRDRVRRGVGNDTPLMLVLRKYMRGARLKAVEQPPSERILHFHFQAPAGTTVLVVELLGTRSNLMLLDADHTILGVARLSRPDEQTHRRTLLPNHFYHPPAPQDKLVPQDLTEFTLRRELQEASPQFSLARLLPQLFRGVSPLLAREIVYRATGSSQTKVEAVSTLDPLVETFRQLFDMFDQATWQPSLAFDEDDIPIGFAAYPLHHLHRTEPRETMSEVIETYFAEAISGYAAAKAPLLSAIKEARQRLSRRRTRLEQDAASQANPEALKEKGEAVLAYAYQIEAGQTELQVEWSLEGGEPLKVSLDPTLSPSENAQQYFKRYRKALRASEEIPGQLQKIDLEETYLNQLAQDVAMAEDRPDIDSVAGTLAEANYYKPGRKHQKRQKKSAANYLRLTAPDGARVFVGKNAVQNAQLTFNRATADDLWLHARNIPGAHVIIPTAQGLPSESDVFWAASVAAYYSKARHDKAVDVVVTLKKHVRAIKGAALGLVTFRNESTLRVTPEAPEIL
ncbi:MAG: NFACT family protein, partial [Chloroflexota bacterium]